MRPTRPWCTTRRPASGGCSRRSVVRTTTDPASGGCTGAASASRRATTTARPGRSVVRHTGCPMPTPAGRPRWSASTTGGGCSSPWSTACRPPGTVRPGTWSSSGAVTSSGGNVWHGRPPIRPGHRRLRGAVRRRTVAAVGQGRTPGQLHGRREQRRPRLLDARGRRGPGHTAARGPRGVPARSVVVDGHRRVAWTRRPPLARRAAVDSPVDRRRTRARPSRPRTGRHRDRPPRLGRRRGVGSAARRAGLLHPPRRTGTRESAVHFASVRVESDVLVVDRDDVGAHPLAGMVDRGVPRPTRDAVVAGSAA